MTHPEAKTNTPPPLPRRRLLFTWLWRIVGVIACLEFGWLTATVFRTRRRRETVRASGTIVDVGMANRFQPGTVTAVPHGQLYLACLDDGSFLALSHCCTHLGCALPWDEERGRFVCPCHGSTFDLHGMVMTAPAIRPLDYYRTRIENGMIRVDLSHPIKRERFDPSQTARI